MAIKDTIRVLPDDPFPWKFRIETIPPGGLPLPGWRAAGADRLRGGDGRLLWVLRSPAGSRLEDDRLVAPAGGVAELVELSAGAASAFERDRSEPMTVMGSFEVLGPPGDLRRFLVLGDVLDTNLFDGRRCPSEQVALGIWRIAQRRGGPFWTGVADHVADWAEARSAAAPDGLAAHDNLGRGEVHARMAADAVLLLAAAGRVAPADRALRGLERLSMPVAGGRWYLHDSLETGPEHRVLNTHVHTQLARRAFGRDVSDAWPPLADVLRAPSRDRPRAMWHAAAFATADAVRAVAPELVGRRTDHLADRAEAGWAAARAGDIALALPGGRLARDTGLPPAPAYATVNLLDLAAAAANGAPPAVRAVLDRGLRWASATGQFAAARRRRDPLAPLVPALLAIAGRRRAAVRAAEAVRRAGGAPMPGWPGYEDAPWPGLAPGTP